LKFFGRFVPQLKQWAVIGRLFRGFHLRSSASIRG
jgi:hypothetical protein